MIVEMPFVYEVEFKEPRQPSWSRDKIYTTMPLPIEDIDAADAPVAHVVSDSSQPQPPRWERYGSSDKRAGASKFHVPGGECMIRDFGGRFYASRFRVDDLALYRGVAEFDPFAVLTWVKGRGESASGPVSTALLPKRPEDRGRDQSTAVTMDEFNRQNPNAKRFTSERAAWETALRGLARRFAVIGGVIHEEIFEPVLSVVVGDRDRTVSIYVEEVLPPDLSAYKKGQWRGEPHERTRFGLDEYDRALAFAARWAETTGYELVKHAAVQSVDPQLVTFRGDHEYLFMAARRLIDAFDTKIPELSEPVGLAVAEAANQLAVHDRLHPASLRAVRHLAAVLGDFGGETARDPLVRRMQDALAHWDDRDVSGLEWLESSTDALPVFDYPRRAFEVTSRHDVAKCLLKWDGEAADIERFDPETTRLVVVEDFEAKRPLAAVHYPRVGAPEPIAAWGNSSAGIDADLVLAGTYVTSDRRAALDALRDDGARPKFG